MSLNQRLMVTAIVRRGNRYLVLKRSRWNEAYSGQWQFPEGGIKFGESPEKALARELREETGMVLKKAEMLGVCSSCIRYRGKKIWHFVRLPYAARVEGRLKLSRAHKEARWMGRRQLKELKWLRGFKFNEIEELL